MFDVWYKKVLMYLKIIESYAILIEMFYLRRIFNWSSRITSKLIYSLTQCAINIWKQTKCQFHKIQAHPSVEKLYYFSNAI